MINIARLDIKNLDMFCSCLEVLAKPILIAFRFRPMSLILNCNGSLFLLTEEGKPYGFTSIDSVMDELDGVPNIDLSKLNIDTSNY